MTAPLSQDLRQRLIRAVEEGSSARAAAKRFEVNPSAAIKLVQRVRRTDSTAPSQIGGYRKRLLAEHEDLLRELTETRKGIILKEIKEAFAERGIEAGSRRSGRRCAGSALDIKKSMRAAEQDRPDVADHRSRWRVWQKFMDAGSFVFLDETAITTNMMSLRGWGPKSERLVDAAPFGHRHTTTFIAGLRATGLTAPLVLDGPMTGDAFRAYIRQFVAPTLSAGDVLVVDNLPAHKVAGIREAVAAVGATILYLLPYSPDLNPIEQMFEADGPAS